jgi:D-alanine-D-alanine ligase
MTAAFRDVGAYVQLFNGELPLLQALASGGPQGIRRPLKLIYNGIEGGIGPDAFEPGRKALVPAVADAYRITCANSNAYACALGRHKFHYFTVLRALGVRAPRTWHYRGDRGWAGASNPPEGLKVIAKSTYEAWSVGVTESSVFVVDDTCAARVKAIESRIGQPVTVQEFIAGPEVCVPVIASPEPITTPPVEALLTKAPNDPDAVTTIEDNLDHAKIRRELYSAPKEVIAELNTLAIQAFDALELRGVARIDFRVDSERRPWLTDVGVSPGLARENSAFTSAETLGVDYPTFLRVVVAASLAAGGHLD